MLVLIKIIFMGCRTTLLTGDGVRLQLLFADDSCKCVLHFVGGFFVSGRQDAGKEGFYE
jgi:hypothetical protein